MSKDTRDRDTLNGKILTNRHKLYEIEEEMETVKSKILDNVFSFDIFKYLKLYSKLNEEKSNTQIIILAHEATLSRASFFDNQNLMLFFTKLISAFEGEEYECTATYLPSYENQKQELNYVVSKKSTNDYPLENIKGIIKFQKESDYIDPLVLKAPADIATSDDYILANKTSIAWKYPYLIDAIDTLISYRLRHPKVSPEEAIDNVLRRYVPKFEHLKKEEKTKIMKLAL